MKIPQIIVSEKDQKEIIEKQKSKGSTKKREEKKVQKPAVEEIIYGLPSYEECLSSAKIKLYNYDVIKVKLESLGYFITNPQHTTTNIKRKKGSDYLYTGHIHNTYREGIGLCVFKEGYMYEGYWGDDKPFGEGRCIWGNGDYYEGLWERGKRHGVGIMYFHDGKIQKGKWEKDKYLEEKDEPIDYTSKLITKPAAKVAMTPKVPKSTLKIHEEE